jgi:hypothetical protein
VGIRATFKGLRIMNINLVKASIVMASVEDSTAVDRHLLIEDPDFIDLFKGLLNNGLEMQEITNQLKTYVSNHY